MQQSRECTPATSRPAMRVESIRPDAPEETEGFLDGTWAVLDADTWQRPQDPEPALDLRDTLRLILSPKFDEENAQLEGCVRIGTNGMAVVFRDKVLFIPPGADLRVNAMFEIERPADALVCNEEGLCRIGGNLISPRGEVSAAPPEPPKGSMKLVLPGSLVRTEAVGDSLLIYEYEGPQGGFKAAALKSAPDRMILFKSGEPLAIPVDMLDEYRIAVNRDKSLIQRYVDSLPALSPAQRAHLNKFCECVAQYHEENPGAKIPRRAERPGLEFSDDARKAALGALPDGERAGAIVHHIVPYSNVPRDAQCEKMASDPRNAIALTPAQNKRVEAVGSPFYYQNVLYAPKHVAERYGRLAVTPTSAVQTRVRAPAGAGSGRPRSPPVAATASQAAPPPGNPVPPPGETSPAAAARNEPHPTAPPALPAPAPVNSGSGPTARVVPQAQLDLKQALAAVKKGDLESVKQWVTSSNAPTDDSIYQALNAACDSNRMDTLRLLAGHLFERRAGAFDKWIELAVRGNHVDRIEALFRFRNNGESPEPAARALALGLPLATRLGKSGVLERLLHEEAQKPAPLVVGEALCAAAEAGKLDCAKRLLEVRPGVARSHGSLAAEAAMSGDQEAVARHLQRVGIELPAHVDQWLAVIDAWKALETDRNAGREAIQGDEKSERRTLATRLSEWNQPRREVAAVAPPRSVAAEPRPARSLARWVVPAFALVAAVVAPLVWRGLSGRGSKDLVGAGGDAPREPPAAKSVGANWRKSAVGQNIAEYVAAQSPEALREVLTLAVESGSGAAAERFGGAEAVRAVLKDPRLKVDEGLPPYGTPPLHLAVSLGHLDVVRWLLERGDIDVNAMWWHGKGVSDGYTPLHAACLFGQVDMIRLLQKERRVSVTQLTGTGDSALMIGATVGNREVIVELLLHRRSNLFAESRKGETAGRIARRLNHREIASLLGAAERTRLDLEVADTSGKSETGQAPSSTSSRPGPAELPPQNAGATTRGPQIGQSPEALHEVLMVAAEHGVGAAAEQLGSGPEAVRAVLKDPRLKVNEWMPSDGFPALNLAVANGHLDVVRWLLERDEIDVNAKLWNDGYAALHTACLYGQVDMIRLLQQDRRVSVTQLSGTGGDSALIVGARVGNPKVVVELLRHPDSNPFAESRDGETAGQIARRLGHHKVASLLDAAETLLKLKPADASRKSDAGLAQPSNPGTSSRPGPAELPPQNAGATTRGPQIGR